MARISSYDYNGAHIDFEDSARVSNEIYAYIKAKNKPFYFCFTIHLALPNNSNVVVQEDQKKQAVESAIEHFKMYDLKRLINNKGEILL